jgi:hypothetical protein
MPGWYCAVLWLLLGIQRKPGKPEAQQAALHLSPKNITRGEWDGTFFGTHNHMTTCWNLRLILFTKSVDVGLDPAPKIQCNRIKLHLFKFDRPVLHEFAVQIEVTTSSSASHPLSLFCKVNQWFFRCTSILSKCTRKQQLVTNNFDLLLNL